MSDKHTDAQDWDHGPDEIACSGCNLTMGESRLLAALKRGEKQIRATEGQAQTSAAAGRDTERLNWLNNNFFSDEKGEWDERQAPSSIKWKFFGPMSVQGDIRRVIDAAQSADSTAPGAPVRDRDEWNSAINEIADELEERSNLSIISQFTALCIEFDRLRDAAPTAQQSRHDRSPYIFGVKQPLSVVAQQSLTAGGAIPDLIERLRSLPRVDTGKGMYVSALALEAALAAAPLPQVQSEALDALRDLVRYWDNARIDADADNEEMLVIEARVRKLADQQPVTPSGALADNDGGVK